MDNVTPDSELLYSLRKLARGLSALFWGLPAVLLISAETARADYLQPIEIVPAMVANLVLLYGIRQMSSFQKQERPWRNALDRAWLVGFINFGLCPFLFLFNQMPWQNYFRGAILILAISSLFFLFNLNVLLQRLGAMLPDETLRQDINHFTGLNRWLLAAFIAYVACGIAVILHYPDLPYKLGQQNWYIFLRLNIIISFLLGLSPLAITMGLLWKTKEVIFDGVFRGK
ncbi:MAG TPA: hypothetical protein VMH87_02075 [Pseudomonadales bacterium]|nr:hypothetical protein [Pseudomonadales bacterium]